MIPDQEGFNIAASTRVGRRFLRRKLREARQHHARGLESRERLRAATVQNEQNVYQAEEVIRRIEAALGGVSA